MFIKNNAMLIGGTNLIMATNIVKTRTRIQSLFFNGENFTVSGTNPTLLNKIE
jgi:hypothetical protein